MPRLAPEGGDRIVLRSCPICRATFAVSGRRSYCSMECRRKAEMARRPIGPGRGKRRPLPDTARDTGWALRKDVERLERIFADDRFAENKTKVAAHMRRP